MTMKTVKTQWVRIYMAGDIAQAKQIIRKECMSEGLCVTIHARDYVYTGGEESGFVVELINYPRFPSTPNKIWLRAMKLAHLLRDGLYQHSFLVMDAKRTSWNSKRKDI